MDLLNKKHGSGRAWGSVAGAILAAASGLVYFQFEKFGAELASASFDFPFALRSAGQPKEVAIIYLDDESHRDLGQPYNATWDRSLHARLLDVLSQQRAKVVAFDILFADPNTNSPAADKEFVAALQKHGKVILPANYDRSEPAEGVTQETLELPSDEFLKACAGWGNAKTLHDSKYAVRSQFPMLFDVAGNAEVPTLAQATARAAGSP